MSLEQFDYSARYIQSLPYQYNDFQQWDEHEMNYFTNHTFVPINTPSKRQRFYNSMIMNIPKLPRPAQDILLSYMNYTDFSNAWSAVITRAYNLPAERWATANDILYNRNEKRIQLLEKYFNSNCYFLLLLIHGLLEGSSAMLPVFDIPNHRNPPSDLTKQKTNPSFEIKADHGYYLFWSDLAYKKGQEYSYMYTPHFFNAHLVEGYGFAVPDNHGDYVDLQIPNLIQEMGEK